MPNLPLAGRGIRLLARILDAIIPGILSMFFIIPLMTSVGFGIQQAAQSGLSEEQIADQVLAAAAPQIASSIGLFLLLILVYGIVQCVLLTMHGQTLGKMLLKIKIVKMDTGKNGGFVTNVLLRGLLNWALSAVPFYGLVDICFIFRADQRCIHDFIAGTTVVKSEK